MRRIGGTLEANGYVVSFTALRGDDGRDKWVCVVKTSRGYSKTSETIGLSPWALIGAMVDTALDETRQHPFASRIAAPSQEKPNDEEHARPTGKRRRHRTQRAGRPDRSVPEPKSPGELGRRLDAAESRPVVGASDAQ